jgi:hypothetical protein
MTLMALAALNFLVVPLVVAGCLLPGTTVSRKGAGAVACGSYLLVLSVLAVELCVVVPFIETSLSLDVFDFCLPAASQLVRQINAFLGATCAVPLIAPIMLLGGIEAIVSRRGRELRAPLPPWCRYVMALAVGDFALLIATAVWLSVWTRVAA